MSDAGSEDSYEAALRLDEVVALQRQAKPDDRRSENSFLQKCIAEDARGQNAKPYTITATCSATSSTAFRAIVLLTLLFLLPFTFILPSPSSSRGHCRPLTATLFSVICEMKLQPACFRIDVSLASMRVCYHASPKQAGDLARV
jgi:hypothetical protein